jgi:flagellar protein FlaF
MGFSLVASFAVIGVSILIALEIFTGNMFPLLTEVDESYDNLIQRNLESSQTNINISTVSISVFGVNYNHSIIVQNKGSITLNTSRFTILINGIYQQFTCSKSYLYPEKEAFFNVSNLPGNGDHRLKVVSDNGISDYYEYSI